MRQFTSMRTGCKAVWLGLLALIGPLLFEVQAQTTPHNVLLIIADDIGVDAFSIFNTNRLSASFAATPNLDSLAAQGVRFRNCYGYPSCTPSRSCLLTGRYGFRTGLGAAIDDAHDPYLSPRDFTIPKALAANPQLGFRNAHLGKWHLSVEASDPNVIGGWSHYAGYLAGELESYFDWEKTVNGVTTAHTTNYCTTEITADAINWIRAQGTNRWFLWYAPKSAHAPLHKPPNDLHSYDRLSGTPSDIEDQPKEYFKAMIEALDTEVGRLMANVQLSNTLVMFVSDNGTPTATIQAPYWTNQCKGTLFEGGIRLPMFALGAGIVGTNRWSEALVHAVDIPITLLDMAGVNLAATMPTNMTFDGRSFAAVLRDEPWNPSEPLILSENFGSIIPVAMRGVAVRGQRYKLIKLDIGLQLFFDLQTDPYEHTNLFGNLTTPQLAVFAAMTNRLAGWHNVPAAPNITQTTNASGKLMLSVAEQVGIAYSLERSPEVISPAWTEVPNYARQVETNAALVSLTDPAPTPPARAFYRLKASGR